jgi:hypothetical protein
MLRLLIQLAREVLERRIKEDVFAVKRMDMVNFHKKNQHALKKSKKEKNNKKTY